jgi:hypothetical protein
MIHRIRGLGKISDSNPGISRRFTVCLYTPSYEVRYAALGGDHSQLYKLKHFDLPETKHDPVYNLTIATLYQLKTVDIALAGSKLEVYSMTKSPPLWPPNDADDKCRVKFYAFKEYEEEFPATVPVTIVEGASSLTAENILVKGHGNLNWTPLRAFLLSFPDRSKVLQPSYYAERAQQEWWNRNGKHFPLLNFPKELRLTILSHVVGGGPRMYLNTYRDRDPSIARQYVRMGRSANKSIFRVSKQVRAEALMTLSG